MFATTLALIGQNYTGPARGAAFAVRGTTAGIAVVLGPVIGGLLTDGLGWRWIFLVNLPVAVAALLLRWSKLRRSEELMRARRIDVPGPLLLATGLVALVYALLSANDKGWTDPLILGCLPGAGLALAAFVIVESRLIHPMLDLRLFTNRRFVGTQIGSFTVQGSVFALFVFFSVYFQDHLGKSVIGAGLSFLPIVIPIMIAGAAVGAFLDRIPPRLTIGTALALIGVGLLLMLGVTDRTGWSHLLPGMIITGFGCGIALPALGTLAVDVPPAQVGVASGVNNTALQLGFALGIAIYGAVPTNHHRLRQRTQPPHRHRRRHRHHRRSHCHRPTPIQPPTHNKLSHDQPGRCRLPTATPSATAPRIATRSRAAGKPNHQARKPQRLHAIRP